MGSSSSPASTFLLIALMVVAFYFLIIRPNKKRQQAQLQTMNSLTPGTRVLLTSGVFGTVIEVGDRQAVLEVSPGVELTVLKQAIARTVQASDEDNPEVDDEDFDEDENDARLDGEHVDHHTDHHVDRVTEITSREAPTHGGSHAAGTDDTFGASSSSPDQDPRTGTSSTPTKD